MAADPAPWCLTIASDLRLLALARAFVEGVCQSAGCDAKATDAIVMATDEAVNNIIRHAHFGHPEANIQIQCFLHSDRIEVALAHTLAGYNRHEIKQFMRVNRLLDADHPEALPPERKKRRPRRNRVARFADLSPHTRPPPAS